MKQFYLLLSVVALCSCKNSTISTMEQNRFTGLWKILAIESLDSNGQWHPSSWMRDGTAYLHYDSDSTMSLHFTPSGYEFLTNSDTMIDELRLKSADYWYLARYKVLEDQRIVQHKRIMHANPGEWGKIVQREFKFNGDTLLLFPPEYNMRLTWIRQ